MSGAQVDHSLDRSEDRSSDRPPRGSVGGVLSGFMGLGLLGSVMVLLGGLVVATLPASSGLLQHQLLVGLRASAAYRAAGLGVVLIGLGLLAHAWLALCRQACSAESLPLVHRAAALWSAPLLVAPPLFSRDGWSYAAQGVMAALGYSPYQHGPAVLSGPILQAVDPIWRHTATPYGPLPLWWGDLLAHGTENPALLVVGHRILALCGLVLLAWAMPRLAAWTGVAPARATALVIASPLVLANGVAGLHNDLLMAGLMAAALALAAESWLGAACVCGLAAAVKLPGGLVAAGIVLVSLPMGATLAERGRRLASVAAISLATLFGIGAVSGLGSGWIHALGVPGTVMTALSATSVVGEGLDRVATVMQWNVDTDFFLHSMRALGSAATVVVTAYVAMRGRTGSRPLALRQVGLVVGLAAVLAPSVHLWYFLWPLPFVAALPMRPRRARVLVAALIVGGLIAPLDGSWHGMYLVFVGGIGLIVLILAALALTRPRPGQREAMFETG